MTFERRYTSELRASEEGKLIGYAAVFNSRSEDLGGFTEIILPGAFTRSLTEFPDILALAEHDTSKVLARTTNGTLLIEEDSHGLRVEIQPADVSYARDLLELVRRGDVAGMSFAFRPYPNGAKMEGRTRSLSAVQLREVSITVAPAYRDTSVAVRALTQEQHTMARMRLQIAEVE